jgi:hypothetical protein
VFTAGCLLEQEEHQPVSRLERVPALPGKIGIGRDTYGIVVPSPEADL